MKGPNRLRIVRRGASAVKVYVIDRKQLSPTSCVEPLSFQPVVDVVFEQHPTVLVDKRSIFHPNVRIVVGDGSNPISVAVVGIEKGRDVISWIDATIVFVGNRELGY